MEQLHSLVKWSVVTFAFISVFCHGQLYEMTMKSQSSCPETKYLDLPVGLEKITYSKIPKSNSLLINGFLVVKKELRILILEIQISRCVTEGTDSCLTYFTLNATDVCQQMGKKNMIWSTLFNNTKNFPKKCPIPIARYEIVNAYMDWREDVMALTPGNWKVRMKFFDREEILTCYYAMASIKLTRRRRS